MPPPGGLEKLPLLGRLRVPGLVGNGQSRSWTSNPTCPLAMPLCVGADCAVVLGALPAPSMWSARIPSSGRGLEAKGEEVTGKAANRAWLGSSSGQLLPRQRERCAHCTHHHTSGDAAQSAGDPEPTVGPGELAVWKGNKPGAGCKPQSQGDLIGGLTSAISRVNGPAVDD